MVLRTNWGQLNTYINFYWNLSKESPDRSGSWFRLWHKTQTKSKWSHNIYFSSTICSKLAQESCTFVSESLAFLLGVHLQSHCPQALLTRCFCVTVCRNWYFFQHSHSFLHLLQSCHHDHCYIHHEVPSFQKGKNWACEDYGSAGRQSPWWACN